MSVRITFLTFALFCWFVHPSVAADVVVVPLTRVIANPDQYDGKVVRVTGFVKLEFEGNAIYVHQDDFERHVFKNALWIDVSPAMQKHQADLDERYVLVEGVFNAQMKGHMGVFAGSIQRISMFDVRRFRGEPSRQSRFEFYLGRGKELSKKGEYDQALVEFNEALQLDPNSAETYYGGGQARCAKGEYDKGITDYNQALAINPNYTSVYNELGWLYAVCPEEKYRDGQKAFANANKALQLSGGSDWACIDTLAAAYAECGDFAAAKKWQAKAIDLVPMEQVKAECRARLELYTQGKPYREEPKEKSASPAIVPPVQRSTWTPPKAT